MVFFDLERITKNVNLYCRICEVVIMTETSLILISAECFTYVCGIMKWSISLAEVLEVWVLFGVAVLEEVVVLEEIEVRKILALKVY